MTENVIAVNVIKGETGNKAYFPLPEPLKPQCQHSWRPIGNFEKAITGKKFIMYWCCGKRMFRAYEIGKWQCSKCGAEEIEANATTGAYCSICGRQFDFRIAGI